MLATVGAVTTWMIGGGTALGASSVGETFNTSLSCAAESTNVQPEYAMPSAGVITEWQFEAAASPPNVKLKVARPQGGGFFSIVGESDGGFQTPVPGQLNVYRNARISVQAGDVLGIARGSVASGDSCFRLQSGYTEWDAASADPTPGTTEQFNGPFAGVQFNVSAVLEPDCDSDGFGDESQDPDTSSCNPPQPVPKADGTLTIDANKGKVEKGRKVTLTGQLDVASNESCEQNRAIQIQRRLKSEDDTKFETFETVQTDTTGNYSLKVKVKKTYFYRAVVSETEACDDESSNSQKVRVQKKKAAQEA